MTLRKLSGFTLIELLATLAIMVIVTAIAWPLFHQQKAKVFRQECIAGLSGATQAMEEWRNTVGVYAVAAMNNYKPAINNNDEKACQQRGYKTGAEPFSTCSNSCSITITIPNTQDSYTLTATRVYSAATPIEDKDSFCNVFAINDLGQKSASDLTGATSTFTPVTAAQKQIKANCWLEN